MAMGKILITVIMIFVDNSAIQPDSDASWLCQRGKANKAHRKLLYLKDFSNNTGHLSNFVMKYLVTKGQLEITLLPN